MTEQSQNAVIRLSAATFDVVVDTSTGVPTIVHWGAPLGDVDLDTVVAVSRRGWRPARLNRDAPCSIVPEHGSGWWERPGLSGSRDDGTGWAPRFVPGGVRQTTGGVIVSAIDEVAGLALDTELIVGETLDVRCTLTNRGPGVYRLGHLEPVLPLADHASETLGMVGRWSREAHPKRATVEPGQTIVAENWQGRTSHEHLPLLFAGSAGWGEWSGEVWGVHLAWSGNHVTRIACQPDGQRTFQVGELLHGGEIALDVGQSYRTPWIVGVFSEHGLTPATWGFHRRLRARPNHPRRERKTLLNTWEAVYFDHDHAKLRALADRAAAVGIERFVLDDGWFGGRRDDQRGLGDWFVSPDVYPEGLAPLISYVTSLGLQFGIWVEPEMVNPDSDLFREHPEWAAPVAGYPPVLGRNQLLLDLTNPACFEHILGRIDALLTDHDIGFVKWDMNRVHIHTGHSAAGPDHGRAANHDNTIAVYRLFDELRARHPDVEFESCSSGGGRIDHEILERTVRVWTSDCIDPLERQTIQRHTSMLVPPELMGAHVASPRSHTTGRSHSLAMRTATALFGHFGIEWNLLAVGDGELADVAAAVDLHRRFRPLLHSGDVVRFDPYLDDGHPVSWAHGVYAADRSEALVCVVQLRSGPDMVGPPLRLPGLDAQRRYRIECIDLPGQPSSELSVDELSGRQLAVHGVRLPPLNPESAALVHLVGQPGRPS